MSSHKIETNDLQNMYFLEERANYCAQFNGREWERSPLENIEDVPASLAQKYLLIPFQLFEEHHLPLFGGPSRFHVC